MKGNGQGEDMPDEPSDDEISELLRKVAARLEPVPPELLDAAAEAFAWRDIDAELAELVFDSLADATLVRGAPGQRMISFASGELSLDVQVTATGDVRTVMGQIAPPQPGLVDIRRPDGTVTVEVDELGRFRSGPLPPGPVSLRLRPAGTAAGPAVVTDWVAL
jgi:hypothetical protein